MLVGIDPKVDYAFKWLFGGEKGRSLLIHLLNAILDLPPGEQIVEIEILNPFTEKMKWDDKLSILDIKARDQLGRQFNIEMQVVAPIGLKQRILYYWSKLYTEQLGAGRDYHQLKRTISVCFVDGAVFPTIPEYHSTFRLIDADHSVVLTDDLSIHFFELPKFKLTAEEVKTPLEAWLYFLRYAEKMDPEELPEAIAAPEIRQAVERLMELTKIDIQKEIYEGRLKAQRDALTLSNTMAQLEKDLAQKENERAQAESGRAQAEARAAELEALAKGNVVARIQLIQKLLRRTETPTAELEKMTLEALTALIGPLERELPR